MSNEISTRFETGLQEGNLLNPAIRRDIADLNRLYLDRALGPRPGSDPCFQLPAVAFEPLRVAADEARERAVQCPFTLFEFTLPGVAESVAWQGDAVADAADTDFPSASWTEARRSFGVAALAVVRRLTEGAPMAPRIVFGLGHGLEARLRTLSLGESFRVAAWPGLIRPRWPAHQRFWRLLAELHPESVHWAYATGLCLLGQCERAAASQGTAARAPDARHRRPGISC